MSRLLAGERAAIRPVAPDDVEELARLAQLSRSLHHPWASPPQDAEAWLAWLDAKDLATWAGYVVVDRAGGAIAGTVNVNNIVRSLFRCGALGYHAYAPSAGRGLMTEGLSLVVRHAFADDGLDLHRLEANIQPGNAASIALVRRVGFRLEGLSPDFLFIDGAWRDHERWAITAEMVTS